MNPTSLAQQWDAETAFTQAQMPRANPLHTSLREDVGSAVAARRRASGAEEDPSASPNAAMSGASRMSSSRSPSTSNSPRPSAWKAPTAMIARRPPRTAPEARPTVDRRSR